MTLRSTSTKDTSLSAGLTISVLMKMMEVQGGMTRGRDITDTTLVYFICALPPCIPIMEALENLSGTSSASSEQHVAYKDHKELRQARQNRDTTDLVKFTSWLKTHNPFNPKYQTKLIAVFSGMSADETINCDRADEVGSELQKAMVGKNFAELTLECFAKVLPLSAMTSTIKVRGEAVVIDQQQMLNRVLAVLQSGSELENFFQYEFVNYATSLFDKEAFLNNAQNKNALIGELTKALLLRGVEVKQASGDADLVIALSAMTAADTANGQASVVSRDTYVLVILLTRLTIKWGDSCSVTARQAS